MKKCRVCKVEKDEWEFRARIEKKNGQQYVESMCKECTNKRQRDRNKEQKERKANYKLEYNYDMDRQEWKMILKSQDNKCKLCGKELDSKINTDHDHKTGIVRGLLCSNCNHVLRYFDDPVLHDKFMDYAKNANALKELHKEK